MPNANAQELLIIEDGVSWYLNNEGRLQLPKPVIMAIATVSLLHRPLGRFQECFRPRPEYELNR